jgi:glycosyltransferase involved in cell wall biosynthesis
VVSTTLGAEGLARRDGDFCALADEPRAFADSVIRLLEDPVQAADLAARARREVETNWDMAVVTSRLVEKYRALIAAKRAQAAKKAKHSRLTIEIEVK